jgi:hypothetical protein
MELDRRAEGKRLFSQRHKRPITRNYKLTRHTLRRIQLCSVDADILHRATGATSFLRALLNTRGEERFTPVLHGALLWSLHPSALLKVFTTEGGLSTRFQHTYVYSECPYIKVNVRFKAASNEGNGVQEEPDDIIESIEVKSARSVMSGNRTVRSS